MDSYVDLARHNVVEALRIQIDGEWTAKDFAGLCSSLDYLYDLGLVLGLASAYSSLFEFAKKVLHGGITRSGLIDQLRPNTVETTKVLCLFSTGLLENLTHPDLAVKHISYGSKGSVDVEGQAAAVGQISALLLELVKNPIQPVPEPATEDDEELHRQHRRTRAETFLKIAGSATIPDKDRRSLVHSIVAGAEPVFKLAESGRVLVRAVRPEAVTDEKAQA